MSGRAIPYYLIGAAALVGTLYNNFEYMGAYSAKHPNDSGVNNFTGGLIQFFRDCFSNPTIALISCQLFVAAGLCNAAFKIESRRNSLSLDRVMVFLGYVIAVAPMFAFFNARVASAPRADADGPVKRTGNFHFRGLMYFTLLNCIILGVLIQTPVASPRFVTLLSLYGGLMLVYLVLPSHGGEKTGPLTVRAIRQSSWIYGSCAGAGVIIAASSYAHFFAQQSDLSLSVLLGQATANAAIRSIAIDYVALVLTFMWYIATDNRLRDDAGAGARIALVILTPLIPAVTYPLFTLHRENVDAESALDQIEANTFKKRN